MGMWGVITTSIYSEHQPYGRTWGQSDKLKLRCHGILMKQLSIGLEMHKQRNIRIAPSAENKRMPVEIPQTFPKKLMMKLLARCKYKILQND